MRDGELSIHRVAGTWPAVQSFPNLPQKSDRQNTIRENQIPAVPPQKRHPEAGSGSKRPLQVCTKSKLIQRKQATVINLMVAPVRATSEPSRYLLRAQSLRQATCLSPLLMLNQEYALL